MNIFTYVRHPMIITYILLFTLFVSSAVVASYELPDLPRIILLRGGNIDDIDNNSNSEDALPKVRPIFHHPFVPYS